MPEFYFLAQLFKYFVVHCMHFMKNNLDISRYTIILFIEILNMLHKLHVVSFRFTV